MDRISPFKLQVNVLRTVGKATILCCCKHWWIIGTVLWISILAGPDLCMMHVLWPALNCTNMAKWEFCSQYNLSRSKVFQFLSWLSVTLNIHYCQGLWSHTLTLEDWAGNSPCLIANWARARVVNENAFGRLKVCWWCLLKRNDTNIAMMPTFVAACAILHNMCEIHGDKFDEE